MFLGRIAARYLFEDARACDVVLLHTVAGNAGLVGGTIEHGRPEGHQTRMVNLGGALRKRCKQRASCGRPARVGGHARAPAARLGQCRSSTEVGQLQRRIGQIRGQVCLTLARHRPKLARHPRTSASHCLGQIWADVGQRLGRTRPKSADSGPTLAKFGLE